MAFQVTNGITTDTGTGAVQLPDDPIEHTQDPGDTPTGAVDGPAAATVTEFGPDGQEPTDASPNPPAFVTVDGPFGKVMRPPRQSTPQAQTTTETDQPTQGRRRADTGTVPTQAPASQPQAAADGR